jgi:23S rRNA (guanosine2251-2'-O)-methyltransferase
VVRAGIHAVLEALRARKPLTRVVIAKGAGSPRIQEIIDLCRTLSVPVRFEPREALDRIAGAAAHQGVAALGAVLQATSVEDILPGAHLIVLLDGVEDPHNLGAIVRTAHAAGADAIVTPERRAAGLTETVSKAAAGALEYLPVAHAANVAQTLELLKKKGFWIYGIDERGTETYDRVEYADPAALVFGGEGKGLHQNVRKHCDVLVSIPLAGKISSLNVSVAAGIVLFEWKRRRKSQ